MKKFLLVGLIALITSTVFSQPGGTAQTDRYSANTLQAVKVLKIKGVPATKLLKKADNRTAFGSDSSLTTLGYFEGVTTITYSAPRDTIDFFKKSLQTISLAGTDTFNTANLFAGHRVSVRIIAGASLRSLVFPSLWTWMSAVPTQLAANKVALLTLRSFSTNDVNVIATWEVLP